VCGAQYRKLTASLLTPLIRPMASWPSSTKSSGCGSRWSWRPSRSKIGTSSSIERHHSASLPAGSSGRPLNSLTITWTPSSTVISMARFQ
jgi:hypothetical protein